MNGLGNRGTHALTQHPLPGMPTPKSGSRTALHRRTMAESTVLAFSRPDDTHDLGSWEHCAPVPAPDGRGMAAVAVRDGIDGDARVVQPYVVPGDGDCGVLVELDTYLRDPWSRARFWDVDGGEVICSQTQPDGSRTVVHRARLTRRQVSDPGSLAWLIAWSDAT